MPCLIASQFLYLSFVTIIRETSSLCSKLKAIFYLVQFPHFCTHADMISAYKVLIYTNSCYIADKVLISYTKCYSISFDTFCLRLTLRLLMSYIYMELLVKPEILTSYIYGSTFGNAETVSFYLLYNVSTLNQCREVSCVTFVCKHFAS